MIDQKKVQWFKLKKVKIHCDQLTIFFFVVTKKIKLCAQRLTPTNTRSHNSTIPREKHNIEKEKG